MQNQNTPNNGSAAATPAGRHCASNGKVFSGGDFNSHPSPIAAGTRIPSKIAAVRGKFFMRRRSCQLSVFGFQFYARMAN